MSFSSIPVTPRTCCYGGGIYQLGDGGEEYGGAWDGGWNAEVILTDTKRIIALRHPISSETVLEAYRAGLLDGEERARNVSGLDSDCEPGPGLYGEWSPT